MNRATVFQGLFIPICIIVLSFSIGVFVNSFIDRKSRQKFENVGVSYDSDLDKVERVTLDVAHEVMKRINHKIGKKPAV
jgi:small-conductance mechanosensitive channel